MDYYLFEEIIPIETARDFAKIIYTLAEDDIHNPRAHFKFFSLQSQLDNGNWGPIFDWDPNHYVSQAISFAEEFIKNNFIIENSFDLKRCFAHVMDTGAEIEPHIDDGDIYENKPKQEKHYSAVIVLNDDYNGGEFYFTNLNEPVSLSAGSMIIFRGDTLRKHGVTKVTSGYRVSIPIFFRDYIQE